MIGLAAILAAILRALGLDARLYEDGSAALYWAAGHIGLCILAALGCAT